MLSRLPLREPPKTFLVLLFHNKLVKHLNKNLRLNLLLNLIYNITRLDMHKERDTSLQRSYLRGDLLASLTRRSFNIPCLDIHKERDTSLQQSYSRGDLLASLRRQSHDKNKKWRGYQCRSDSPSSPFKESGHPGPLTRRVKK